MGTGRAAGPSRTLVPLCALALALGPPSGGVRDARHAWVVPSCLLLRTWGWGETCCSAPTPAPLSDKLSPLSPWRACCAWGGRGACLAVTASGPPSLAPPAPTLSSPTCLKPNLSLPSQGPFSHFLCFFSLPLLPVTFSRLTPWLSLSGAYFS